MEDLFFAGNYYRELLNYYYKGRDKSTVCDDSRQSEFLSSFCFFQILDLTICRNRIAFATIRDKASFSRPFAF